MPPPAPINLFSALDESQGERQLNVVLAWLLDAVKPAITELLASFDIVCDPLRPKHVEFQAGSTEQGFPDLVISASGTDGRSILVALELKIDAELTELQRTGYAQFRESSGADESHFVVLGPSHHASRYRKEIEHLSGAKFFSVEDFISLLSASGYSVPLDLIGSDLRDFFLPQPIAKGQLQRDLVVAGSLSSEERRRLPVRRLCGQFKGILSDHFGDQIWLGPVFWGHLKQPDPYIGFLMKPNRESDTAVWMGFWLRKDLEDGIPFSFSTSSESVGKELERKGQSIHPAKYTKWAKVEWLLEDRHLDPITPESVFAKAESALVDLVWALQQIAHTPTN